MALLVAEQKHGLFYLILLELFVVAVTFFSADRVVLTTGKVNIQK